MKKILIISMRFPFPTYGGEKIAIFNYLKSLDNENFEVDLISLEDGEKVTEERIEGLKKEINNLNNCNVIYLPKWVQIIGAILSILKLKPLQVGYFSNFLTINRIKNITKNKAYSSVFLHSVRMFPLVKIFKDSKIVMYYVDAISMNFKNAIPLLKFPYKLIYQIEGPILKRYEKKSLTGVDVGIMHSLRDLRFLGWAGNKKLKLIPILNNHKLEFVPITNQTKKRFLFIANYKSLPNIEATKFLISLDKKFNKNQIKIDLIGANLNDELKKKADNCLSINYIGAVEKLESEIIDSYGVLCPINIGAGMQNKILDAISNGRLAISNVYAAEPYRSHFILNKVNFKDSGIVEYKSKDELIEKLIFINNVATQNNERYRKAYFNSSVFSLENNKKIFSDCF